MRKTPHTKLKKSAFELHYGRKPNTEISNLLSLDNLKNLTKNSISAKPDTLQVYSFSEVGGVSDQLPMKTRKSDKGVSNHPFLFLEKKTSQNKVRKCTYRQTEYSYFGNEPYRNNAKRKNNTQEIY